MNPRSLGRGDLMTKISQARSQRKRAAALSAARKGLSVREIMKAAGVHSNLAGRAITEYRLQTMPHLVDHAAIVDGKVYEDLRKLSERFSLSEVRLGALAKEHNLPSIRAINPQTSRMRWCFQPELISEKLVSWRVRQAYYTKYAKLLTSLRVERYSELTEPQMATLLGLVILLKETGGLPPSYQEIELAAGLPASKAHLCLPELEKLGFISRLPVYNPRRGQPPYRYLVHRAPAKLVSQPIRCPDCTATIWIPYPWYQGKRTNGNGVGK